jgi:hypothetical protein
MESYQEAEETNNIYTAIKKNRKSAKEKAEAFANYLDF